MSSLFDFSEIKMYAASTWTKYTSTFSKILKSSTQSSFEYVPSHKKFKNLLVLSSVFIILVDTFSAASYTRSVTDFTCFSNIFYGFKSQHLKFFRISKSAIVLNWHFAAFNVMFPKNHSTVSLY